jgi:hypothetical protein
MAIENLKFRLIKELPSLKEGAVFVFNEEYGQWTNDPFSICSYLFNLYELRESGFFEEIEEE